MPLRSCPACQRHVRASDVHCPFCQSALPPSGLVAMQRMAIGGALMVSAAATTDCAVGLSQPLYGVTAPSAVPSASATPTPPAAQPAYGIAVPPSATPASTTPTPGGLQPLYGAMAPTPSPSPESTLRPLYGAVAPQQ